MKSNVSGNVILAVALFLLLILCCTLFVTTETKVASAAEIKPFVVEADLEYTNTICELDNMYRPIGVGYVYDSKGNIINCGSDVNLEAHEFNANGSFSKVSCYVRHKEYYKRNRRTNVTEYASNYFNRVNITAGKYYKIKIQTNKDIINDSWSGGVEGVSGSNSRIGKGAIFYRINEYNSNGTYQLGAWTKLYDIFRSSQNYYLGLQINHTCDLEIINVYEKYVEGAYYNLRQEFKICFRDSNAFVFTQEVNTNSELTRTYSVSEATTNHGFYITPSGYMDVSINYNGGGYVNYTFAQLEHKSFVDDGVYDIKFFIEGNNSTYTHTIVVDKAMPSIILGQYECTENYEHIYNGYFYCDTDSPLTISWPEDEDVAPISVKIRQSDGTYTDVSMGDVFSAGSYSFYITKNYTHQVLGLFMDVIIDNFTPVYNYDLLLNGEQYSMQPNRFSTRYYGVSLTDSGQTVNFGYAAKEDALTKGYSYEWDKQVVVNPDGTYSYRGTTYANNALVTAAINDYVLANYYFENRDLSDNNTTVLETSLQSQTLYLNGFRFMYQDNPVYSQSVRMFKATAGFPTLDDNVKSVLRDENNPNVLTILYGQEVGAQLVNTGKYYILETNCFGNEYFYEAIYVATNTTEMTLTYDDINGIEHTTVIDSAFSSLLQGTQFDIISITNEFDEFATVKIVNADGSFHKILVAGDNCSLTLAGEYTLTFIDRNGNTFVKTLSIVQPQVMLIGVENSGTADNDVTISLEGGYTITGFFVNGVQGETSAFELNPENQRYEYVVEQSAVMQQVVLFVSYPSGQSYTIAFTVNSI